MDGYITIGTKLDTSGIDSDIKGLKKDLEKKTSDLANSVSKGFRFIKGAIIGAGLIKAFRAISGSIDDAISRFDTLNNYTKVMSNLGIASEDAQKSLDYLTEKLDGLPTTLDDAVSSVQRFASANGNIKASTQMFVALNNAILAGGAPMQVQATALEQLSQAYAKGKPDMMEWRSALSAMPAQLKQVAIAMGYASSNELGEALRSGKISMNDFMKTLIQLNKEGANGFKSFEEQARNSTGGIATSIINIKTAITRGLAQIMDAIGQSNIAGFFNGIRNAINSVIPYIVAFIKLIKIAFGFIGGIFGKKASSNVQETKSSVDNLNTSIGTTSDNLNDATGSAKSLNKELKNLQGFDELNVLQEASAEAGGAGGTSVGGASVGELDFGDLETSLDNVSSKADEIVEKIKNNVKKIMDIVQPVIQFFKGVFDTITNDIISPSAKLFKKIVYDTLKVMSDLWKKYGKDILNNIGETIKTTIELFKKIYNDILKPIIQPFLENLNWLWDKHLKDIVKEVGEFVAKLINGALEIYNKFIVPLVMYLIDKLAPAFSAVSGFIIGVMGSIVAVISDTIKGIIKVLSGIIDFIAGVFTGNWKKAWQGIVYIFKGIVDMLVGSVKFLINIIIDALNGFIYGLNKLQIPDWVPRSWRKRNKYSKNSKVSNRSNY